MQGSGISSKRIYGGNSMGDDDVDRVNERLKKELQEKNMIIERLLRNQDLRGRENIMNLSSKSTSQNAGLAKSALPSANVQSVEHAKSSAPVKFAKSFAPPKSASTHVQCFEHNQSAVPIKILRQLASSKSTPPSAPIKYVLPSETTNSTPVKSAPHISANSLPLQIGAQVFVKSFVGNVYVAKGIIVSLSPSKLVGNEELGNGWCEVKVTVAIKSEEELIKKIGRVTNIQQAVGRSIAWPKHLVDHLKVT